MVRPSRSSAIQSPSGTRTPEVVPFQVNTIVAAEIGLGHVGQFAVSGFDDPDVVQLELLGDVGRQPLPKLSHWKISTPRSHPGATTSAISTAPVSEAATMPIR